MPADSPYKASWWYRTEFRVAPQPDGQVWLGFDGINDRANVWLNGKLIADVKEVMGAYRTYTFNVTSLVHAEQPNVLAVEVFPPDVRSLAVTWVDWNPMPPDKNMGLWRDVHVTTTGPVALRFPQVVTRVDLPGLEQAHLLVLAELRTPAIGRARPHSAARSKHQVRTDRHPWRATRERVEFTPDRFPQLNLSHPPPLVARPPCRPAEPL